MAPKPRKKSYENFLEKRTEVSPQQNGEYSYTVFDEMLEGVQIIGHDWRYIYLNEAAQVHNRRPNEELLGQRYMDMWPGIEETYVFEVIKRCMDERVASRLENRFVFPDGAVGWFMLSIQPILEGTLILSYDITNRVSAEKKAEQMKRLYATLSQVNQTIVRVGEREELFQTICAIAVEYGEFALAWIGLLDEKSGDVYPVAAKGMDVSQWPFRIANIRKGRLKNGLVATAIRSSKVVTSEDLQANPNLKSLHEQFQELGYHSSAAVPILFDGKVIGVLCLVSLEADLFQAEDEISLLEEMGLDISFALDTFETKFKREQADEKIERQNQRLKVLREIDVAILTADSVESIVGAALSRIRELVGCRRAAMALIDWETDEVVVFDVKTTGKTSISSGTRIPLLPYQDMFQIFSKNQPVLMNDLAEIQDLQPLFQTLKDEGLRSVCLLPLFSQGGQIGAFNLSSEIPEFFNAERVSLAREVADQVAIAITQSRLSESLRESEELYHRTLDNMLEGCQIIDFGWRYLYVNNAVAKQGKQAKKALLGHTMMEMYPGIEDTELFTVLRDCMKNRVTRQLENKFVYPDGTHGWFELNIQPVPEGIFILSIDITERKQAEEKLRLQSSALEAAANGIVITDVDGNIQWANPAFTRLTGFALEDAIGKTPGELVRSGFQNKAFYKDMWDTILAGKVWRGELINRRKDGTFYNEEMTLTPLKDEQGEITHFIAVKQDISTRIQAEEELQKSEQNLRRFVNNSPDTIYFLDLDSQKAQYLNREEFLGYSKSELEAPGSIMFALHPGDGTAVRENWQQVIHNDISKTASIEYRLRRKDGDWEWIHQRATVLSYKADGSPKQLLITLSIITDRKRAEQALRESQEQLFGAIDSSMDAIISLNADQHIILFNPAAEQMFRCSAEEASGQPIDHFLPERYRASHREYVRAFGESNKTRRSMESMALFTCLRANGEEFPAEINISQTVVEGKKIFTAFLRDATEQVRNEKLQVAVYGIARAAISVQSLDELYATIHEILQTLLPAKNFYIALYDHEKNLLSFPYFQDEFDDTPTTIDPSGSLTGYVLRTGAPLLATLEVVEKLTQKGEIQLFGSDSNEWLGVPLIMDGQSVGVMAVQSYDENLRFGMQDLDVMAYVSTQVANAIKRKKTVEILQNNEQQFRSIFEQSPLGMGLVDIHSGRFLQVNPRYCEIVGRTRDEMLKMDFNTITHPDDVDIEADERQKLVDGEIRSFDFDKRYLRPDQSIVWVHVTVVAFWMEGEKPSVNLTMVEDITKRKKADAKLHESEKKYRDLINGMNDTIWVIDFDTTILDVNNTAVTVLGYTREELLSMKISDIDLDLTPEQIQNLADTMPNDKVQVFETWHTTKDGRKLPVEVSSSLVSYVGKTAIMSIARDVTERKQAEKALRESEERFRSLYENSTIGLYRTTPEGKILLANPTLVNMLGYASFEDLTQRDLEEEGYDPNYKRSNFRKQIETEGIVRSLESAWTRKDGGIVYVRESAKAIQDSNGKIVYYEGTVEDITEQIQVQEKLRESEALFSKVFHDSPIGINIFRLSDGRSVNINDAFLEIIGYSRDEVLKHSAVELKLFVDVEARNALIQTLREGKKVYNQDAKIRQKSGEIRDVLASIDLIELKGEPMALMITSDITERKQIEEALQESQSILSTAEDVAKVGSWKWDLRTQKVHWSEGMFRLFGVEREGFDGDINRMVAERIHPDDAAAVQESNRKVLESSEPIPLSYRIVLPDGKVRIVWTQGKLLHDEIGLPVALTGYVQDITERIQAENALRESEERLQLFIDHAPASLAMFDRDMRYLAVSNRWRNDYQLGKQDIIGKSYYEIFPEISDEWKDVHQRGLAGAIVRSEDDKFIRADGGVQWLKWEVRPWYENDGSVGGIVIFTEDITERKLIEQRVQEHLQRLEALRKIDQAISSSFDLKISLNILLSYAIRLLDVDAASVLKLNSKLNILEYITGFGFKTDAIKKSSVKLGESYAGKVALSQQVIQVQNIADEPDSLFTIGFLKNEDFLSYSGAPLIVKGKVIGVLEVFSRSNIERNKEWFNFFNSLAGQAGIAIDNLTLFNDLQTSNLELLMAYDATIEGWSLAMNLRDEETEGHTRRVTDLTLKLAEKMGISRSEWVHIRRGALLHDIGKLGVPDHILRKPDKLTETEMDIMRKHPNYAFEMLTSITYLRPAIDIPYCHHEKWDGSGYPRGLSGEKIPLAARLFAIMDVWDALRSDRPYRPAWSEEKSLEYIKSQSGTHFDPDVVEAFQELIEEEKSSHR